MNIKKYIAAFLLVFTLAGFGQTVVPSGSPNQVTDFKGGIKVQKTLNLPVTDAEPFPGQDKMGQVRISPTDSIVRYFNGTNWVKVTTEENEYVTSGTLADSLEQVQQFAINQDTLRIPYTGANKPVDLGSQSLTSDYITAKNNTTPSAGFISYLLRTQSSTGNYGFRVYEDENGKLQTTDYGSGGVSNNTRYGMYSLNGNTTGGANTAIGFNALANTSTGIGLTALGFGALANLTTGNVSTALGYDAGVNVVVGSFNTFLGRRAGSGFTDGSRNIFLTNGSDEATGITTGNGNVIIGRAMGLPSNTSNMIWLGDGYGNPAFVKNGGAVDITGTSLTFNGTPLAGGAFVPTAGGTMIGALTINKTASSGAALIVNQPDTSSGLIAQWQIANVNRATIDSGGRFRSDVGVCNLTSVVNSLVSTLTTGTEISRDVADGNTIGKFKNKNASSTGDFFRTENSAGTVLGGAKYTGQFYQTVAPAAGSNEVVRMVDLQFTIPSYTAVTSNYSTGTARTITANGTFTITLATTGIPDGMEYCIKNIGSGTITISGTIDGVSGATLTAGQVLIVRKTGSSYIKIN